MPGKPLNYRLEDVTCHGAGKALALLSLLFGSVGVLAVVLPVGREFVLDAVGRAMVFYIIASSVLGVFGVVWSRRGRLIAVAACVLNVVLGVVWLDSGGFSYFISGP